MSYYKKKYNYGIKDFKNACLYASTNLSLPAYPKIKASEIKKICDIIYDFQK